MQKIVNCLWYDSNAEEAVDFYLSVFKNSKKGTVSHYTDVGYEIHKRPAGSVMMIEFQLNDQEFLAMNGGPVFKFNEAISLMIMCDTQEEIDYYWDKLSVGGDPEAQQCGWLKDKYGLSWQVTPTVMNALMNDPAKAPQAMKAMLQMKKMDISKLPV